LTDPANGIVTYDPNDQFESLALNETVEDTFTYTLSDGTSTVEQTVTITITGANDAPTVSDIAIDAVEDGAAVTGNFAGADVDSDDDVNSLTYAITSAPSEGSAVNNGDGSFTFDPGSDFQDLAVGETRNVSFDYTATDGHGAVSQAGTVIVTVTGTNDAPTVLAALSDGAGEDYVGFNVDLLAGASDADNNSVLGVANLSLDSGDASGITVNGTSLTVDPSAYDHLALSQDEVIVYSYVVEDEHGGSVPQTATITITGANDAPVVTAAIDQFHSEDDAEFSVDLLANASDVDNGAVLSIANVSGSGAAFVDLASKTMTVDPADYNSLAVGQSVDLQLSYDVIDGNGGVTPQSAWITITGANDAPTIAAALSGGASEDGSGFNVDLLAGASDVDTGAVLSIANLQFTGDASGITVNGTSLTVDPSAYNHLALNQNEIISYTYNVEGEHGASVPQTATITITGANDAPFVTSANVTEVVEDGALEVISLLAGISDPDNGASLQAIQIEQTPYGVVFNYSNSTLSVFPTAFNYLAKGEILILTHDFVVEDEHHEIINQTATIRITGTNDQPTISGNISAPATEDDSAFSVDLLAGASDPDSLDILSVDPASVIISGDASGITLNGNDLDVDPSAYAYLAAGVPAVITYNYNIIDGEGGSVAQTATITITGTNHAPTVLAALSDTIGEDAGISVDLLAGASDPDPGDTLSVSGFAIDSGDGSGVTWNGNTLDVDAAAYNFLRAGHSEIIEYSFDIVDDLGASVPQTGTLTINGANDYPVLTGPLNQTVNEDSIPFSMNLLEGASDPDGDALNILVISGGTEPAFNIVNGHYMFVYPSTHNDLNAGQDIDLVLDYWVQDTSGWGARQSATITVEGRNDAPNADGASLQGDEDNTITGSFLGRDNDAENDATNLIYTITSQPSEGTLTNNGDGTFTFDPGNDFQDLADPSQSRAVSFQYTATDKQGAVSSPATIELTITGENDGPTVAGPLSISLHEDQLTSPMAFDLLAGMSDQDLTDTHTIGNLSQSGNGPSVNLPVVGTDVVLDPANFQTLLSGETSSRTYTYNIYDGKGGQVTQTATFTITGADDAPVAYDRVSNIFEIDDAYGRLQPTDGDRDDGYNTLIYQVVTGPTNGTFTIDSTGRYHYDTEGAYDSLSVGQQAQETITYNVTDRHGLSSQDKTVAINISGVDVAPVAPSLFIIRSGEIETAQNEFQVNTNSTGDQRFAETAALSGGGYVTVWESRVDNTIMAQLFDNDGQKVGGEIRIDDHPGAGYVGAPVVTALTGGGFVVGWIELIHWNGGGHSALPYGRAFNADGTSDGARFYLDDSTQYSKAPAGQVGHQIGEVQ
jgi:VCBS repeat-containing protein